MRTDIIVTYIVVIDTLIFTLHIFLDIPRSLSVVYVGIYFFIAVIS